jgi:hypothetical protein
MLLSRYIRSRAMKMEEGGRVALRPIPLLHVRVDYLIDKREVVVLEELLRGEGFFPYGFRLLVLCILSLDAEKLA